MANGQAICDKCKRFLREDGGCTHCERSVLMSGKLKTVTIEEAEVILSEPVEVKDKRGNKVVFTAEKLLPKDAHIKKHHSYGDMKRRMKHIKYNIEAARTGDSKTRQVLDGKGEKLTQRTVYQKVFKDESGNPIKAVTIADHKDSIREVFTFYAND